MLRTLVTTLLALGSLGAAAIAVRSARRELESFKPDAHRVPRPSGSALALAEGVDLDVDGVVLRGWWLPSRNQAAVIFLHGSEADRRQLLPEAEAVASRGYGVLLLDSPGHGESGGEIHWDEGERRVLRRSVDFVSQQPSVDPARIGALGFSLGSYILVQGAATDPRIRTVVLSGAFDDSDAVTRHQFRRYGPLSTWPALWADRHGGMHPDVQRPADVIARIAPRPVLIVSGEADAFVPPARAEALFQAAREPKQLYRVPGAGHGDYAQVAGATYLSRLADFFDRALLTGAATTSSLLTSPGGGR